MGRPYTDYREVPWLRRSGMNNIFVLLGMLGVWPFAMITAVALLTGDVYLASRDEDGYLRKWGIVNKIWAFAVLAFWTYVFYLAFGDRIRERLGV
ncbi:MAG: hypothetical protein ACYTKD_05390 [Planctomycetota bacterium]|jgi:hypothetical protein